MKRHVEIVVRFRPPNSRERYSQNCATFDDTNVTITKDESGLLTEQDFAFDRVYGADDGQTSIYTETVSDAVDRVTCGASAVVLAYGQTGSGKTYTIMGEVSKDGISEHTGIFLRVVTDLLQYKKRRAAEVDVHIGIHAVEVYNDDVKDLLSGGKTVKLKETSDTCVCDGADRRSLSDISDAFKVFRVADASRSCKATSMNATSSRSHALFILDILQTDRKDKANFTISQLCVVDLAGSERVKKSGVSGQGMEEAKHINKSLSALGKVIHDLNKGSSHTSFRDSKLTRLLKNCFTDPKCSILLIANASPMASSQFETVSTLRFANCVKNIKASRIARSPELDKQRQLCYTRDTLFADLRLVSAQFEHSRMSRAAPALAASFANHPGCSGWSSLLTEKISSREKAQAYQKHLQQCEAEAEQENARYIEEQVQLLTSLEKEALRQREEEAEQRIARFDAEVAEAAAAFAKARKGFKARIAEAGAGLASAAAQRGSVEGSREAGQAALHSANTELEEAQGSLGGAISRYAAEVQDLHDTETAQQQQHIAGEERHAALRHLVEGVVLGEILPMHERRVTERSLVHTAAVRGAELASNMDQLLEGSPGDTPGATGVDRPLDPIDSLVAGRFSKRNSAPPADEPESGDGWDLVSIETLEEGESDLGVAAEAAGGEVEVVEYLEGPTEVLESMLCDIENELAELDPTRQGGVDAAGLFDSSEDDDDDLEEDEEEEDEEGVYLPPTGAPPAQQGSASSLKFAELRNLPVGHSGAGSGPAEAPPPHHGKTTAPAEKAKSLDPRGVPRKP